MYANTTYHLQPLTAQPNFKNLAPLYQKTVWQGKLTKLAAHLTGRSSELPTLASITGGKAISNQRDLGAQTVAIDQIRGSEDRAGDFDRDFRPLETHTKSRWINIAVARLNGTPLPAVDLIKVGDSYAVRDGHHRISVARALGAAFIDAHVTALELAN